MSNEEYMRELRKFDAELRDDWTCELSAVVSMVSLWLVVIL